MTIVVRVATEADLDALVPLNQVVQSVHAELYPKDFPPTVDPAVLRALLAPHLASILIAEIDAQPVGYVWFEVQSPPTSPFNWPKRRIYIHHMSVVPEARRQGAARALMQHVDARAVAEGIDEVALTHWADNVSAQKFYATQGFTPYRLFLRKRLSDGGQG